MTWVQLYKFIGGLTCPFLYHGMLLIGDATCPFLRMKKRLPVGERPTRGAQKEGEGQLQRAVRQGAHVQRQRGTRLFMHHYRCAIVTFSCILTAVVVHSFIHSLLLFCVLHTVILL